MRKFFAVLALSLAGVTAAPLAASAAPLAGTNNLVTRAFVKTTGGVSLTYWCARESGDIGNTRVQIVSDNQLTAYRDFAADCDGLYHYIGSANVVSNTSLRARIHVYGSGTINGYVSADFTGYYVP